MNFNLGNVVKYVWRGGLKDEAPTLRDLEKARWYLDREIKRIQPKPAHVAPGGVTYVK